MKSVMLVHSACDEVKDMVKLQFGVLRFKPPNFGVRQLELPMDCAEDAEGSWTRFKGRWLLFSSYEEERWNHMGVKKNLARMFSGLHVK